MIIVIQCAASKQPNAGFLRSANGKRVLFVADPRSAPSNSEITFTRPDDLSDTGASWREVLVSYNRNAGSNRFGLYPAYELYQNPAYRDLVDRFSLQKVYILSAGGGLIRADFLTPNYDITFSQSAEKYKRRSKRERFKDFCQLTNYLAEEIVFFGGQDYLPLFCTLTQDVSGRKRVFYNSARTPQVPGVSSARFETRTRTNWHYECIRNFISSRGD
jgi:hypothetical protein